MGDPRTFEHRSSPGGDRNEDVGDDRDVVEHSGARDDAAARRPHRESARRRPSGAPPPLPFHLRKTGVGWLIATLIRSSSPSWSCANGV